MRSSGRRYWRALLCCLFAGLAPVAVVGQPIQFDIDSAVFAYDAEHSVGEFYLAFDATSLPFRPEGPAFLAEVPLDVRIVRQSDAQLDETPGAPVFSDNSGIVFSVQDTSVLEPGQFFIHQFRVLLTPGEYELIVTIPDSDRSGIEARRDLTVPDFAIDRLTVSDVTLASDLHQSSDRSSPFFKNGLEIRPNANRLFGDGLNRLFFYAEAYGVDKAVSGDYTLLAYIAEANRTQPFGGLEQRATRPVRSPDVLVGSFDLASVPSGSYFLHLVLLNDANEALAETASKFFVYNPNVERASTVFLEETFETSEYATMPEDRVEQGLEYAQLVATDQERRRIRALNSLDDKRRFLMEFWKMRDPNPGTIENEYQQEFMQRIEFANERYGGSYAEGWETDQGRVFVRYGQPAMIEPHLYDRDMIPHEIWQYNNIPGEGRAVFVFADRNSFGRFELIHSSVSGERSLPDWQSELRRR